MESQDRYGAGALLPGLPDHLVQTDVITRLPWHDRPVCRTISKAWRAGIDSSTSCPQIRSKSRRHLLPLLQGQFVFSISLNPVSKSRNLVYRSHDHLFITEGRHGPHEVSRTGCDCGKWGDPTYQACRRRRKLPPLDRLGPPWPARVGVVASCGVLYAWCNSKRDKFVLKMDMAAGDWAWSTVSVHYPFNPRAVVCNAMIYVPQFQTHADSLGARKDVVLVHDMMEQQSRLMESSTPIDLRVLPTRTKTLGAAMEGAQQELYTLTQRVLSMSPVTFGLELLAYDVCRDCWRKKEMIPSPARTWPHTSNIYLVNADCFEPAPDGGTNILRIDAVGVFSWFNSFSHKGWIDFKCSTFPEGSISECEYVLDGQIYALLVQDKCIREEDIGQVDREKQQDVLSFSRRFLMKATMLMKTNAVEWEDVGFFFEIAHSDRLMRPVVDDITMMA